jgi:hypothetical protein
MAANTERIFYMYLFIYFLKYIEQQKTTNKLKAKETKYLII